MKRVFALTALVVAAVATLASAQSTGTTPSTKPLAEVAKVEEARRKGVRKPAKVYTNSNLKPDPNRGMAPAATSTPASEPGSATSGSAAAADATPPPPGEAKDEKYWAGRMKDARSAVSRSEIFAQSLQSRINALRTDFVNRDVPVQRAKIKEDLDKSLAELDRVNKDIVAQTKAIKDLEDEARRAGVPAGWLR